MFICIRVVFALGVALGAVLPLPLDADVEQQGRSPLDRLVEAVLDGSNADPDQIRLDLNHILADYETPLPHLGPILPPITYKGDLWAADLILDKILFSRCPIEAGLVAVVVTALMSETRTVAALVPELFYQVLSQAGPGPIVALCLVLTRRLLPISEMFVEIFAENLTGNGLRHLLDLVHRPPSSLCLDDDLGQYFCGLLHYHLLQMDSLRPVYGQVKDPDHCISIVTSLYTWNRITGRIDDLIEISESEGGAVPTLGRRFLQLGHTSMARPLQQRHHLLLPVLARLLDQSSARLDPVVLDQLLNRPLSEIEVIDECDGVRHVFAIRPWPFRSMMNNDHKRKSLLTTTTMTTYKDDDSER